MDRFLTSAEGMKMITRGEVTMEPDDTARPNVRMQRGFDRIQCRVAARPQTENPKVVWRRAPECHSVRQGCK